MLYRYFSELSRYQVEKLAELYQLDLLLFGYSTQVERRKQSPRKLICHPRPQEFLDVAKNVTTEETEMGNENPAKKLNGKRRRWKNLKVKNDKKTKHKPNNITNKKNKIHPKPL